MPAQTTKPKTRRPTAPKVEMAEAALPTSSEAALAACNICGGLSFNPGPNHRLVGDRIPPVCAGCGSFERHRIVRHIFDRVRPHNFARLSALQFGRDRGIAGGWFSKFRRAEEDPKTSKSPSLSLTQIALPDASVDVLVASYVLEALPDYRLALREIGRVISDNGFAFIAVQNPHLRETTQELVSTPKRRRTAIGPSARTSSRNSRPCCRICMLSA